MSKKLEAKVAIVTGSTAGIGKATALLFGEEGASVVVSGRSAERGEEVASQIRQAGGEASFLQADLEDPGVMRHLIDFALARYGRLDVLVNNAYSTAWASVLELDEAEWDRSMNIMLKAVYLGCKSAIPYMVAQGGGSIVNLSSVHGYLAARNSAVYEAAKAGVINLTRQMAVDFGPKGIRVNAICPGWIKVEKTAVHLQEQPGLEERAAAVYPLRRLGEPIEIARAALFLASDDSSFITGHALVVDGGLTIQLHDSLAFELEQYYRDQLRRE